MSDWAQIHIADTQHCFNLYLRSKAVTVVSVWIKNQCLNIILNVVDVEDRCQWWMESGNPDSVCKDIGSWVGSDQISCLVTIQHCKGEPGDQWRIGSRPWTMHSHHNLNEVSTRRNVTHWQADYLNEISRKNNKDIDCVQLLREGWDQPSWSFKTWIRYPMSSEIFWQETDAWLRQRQLKNIFLAFSLFWPRTFGIAAWEKTKEAGAGGVKILWRRGGGETQMFDTFQIIPKQAKRSKLYFSDMNNTLLTWFRMLSGCDINFVGQWWQCDMVHVITSNVSSLGAH